METRVFFPLINTILYIAILFSIKAEAKNQNVLMTEVFAIRIDPYMFNWTYEGHTDQFTYEASLVNYPDLPPWINYLFSEKHHSGFLYGVPPDQSIETVVLDVVGLNRKNYQTRVEQVNIIPQEKLNSAKYELHMKIDNLNVDDMFDTEKMDALKGIFTNNLWKDSEDDLYVTFLKSAVQMGARKPANPNEEEGIVVKLGSEAIFSSELLELQEEVRPLYKMHSCPRYFKRTSVERFFRDAGFVLDWCSFGLVEKDVNNSDMHKSNEKIEEGFDLLDNWQAKMNKAEIPIRSYRRELVLAITLPMVIMTILAFALTFILCFEHDIIGLSDEFMISTQESSPQLFLLPKKHPKCLENLTMNIDHSISPDDLILSCSHSNSPNPTITRGMHCRPCPPPYVRQKHKPAT